MDVMDANRRCPPVSTSRRICVIPRRDPEMLISVLPGEMLISVMLEAEGTVMSCDSSRSSAGTVYSEADFDPELVGSNNSKAATDGSSRVKLDVSSGRGSTMSARTSKEVVATLLAEGEIMDSSNSESDVNIPSQNSYPASTTSYSETDFDPEIVVRDSSEAETDGSSRAKRDAPGWRGSTRYSMRGSRKLLAKLRAEGGRESSNFDGHAIPFQSFSCPSMTSSSEADFDPDHVGLDNSEAAADGSSSLKPDTPGWRGSMRSLMRSSKRLLAKLLAEGDSSSSDSMSEVSGQEFASKFEEDCTYACEGGQKRNSQRTSLQGHESSIARSQLQVQQQPGGRKEGLNRARKGIVSIQKSVKELGKSKIDEYRRKVIVNGVPIKDVDVKKAEEFAGPIHPGSYWYDIHAGFWGVDTGPCLGIIPPCILEFNVPMSKSCAGGTTRVVVNGRELHEKDLERLQFRGLPTTPGKAYCISIDGRVMDESSGKYVTRLGMLAPSLEKNGRGAGIYMPCVG